MQPSFRTLGQHYLRNDRIEKTGKRQLYDGCPGCGHHHTFVSYFRVALETLTKNVLLSLPVSPFCCLTGQCTKLVLHMRSTMFAAFSVAFIVFVRTSENDLNAFSEIKTDKFENLFVRVFGRRPEYTSLCSSS